MFGKNDDNKSLDLNAIEKDEKRRAEVPMAKPAKPNVVTGEVAKPAKPAKVVVGEVVDVTKRLSALARTIKSNQRKAVDAVMAVGEDLIEARDLLGNHSGGSYGKWLKEKVGMSRTTAFRFVQLAETWTGCSKVKQLADLDALRRLSGAPDQAIAKAKTILAAGNRLDMAAANEVLRLTTSPQDGNKQTKPESTLVEVASGFITFRPRAAGTTIDQMISELIRVRKAQRAA